MLELDMATPAFARLVSADAPLDRIYHGLALGEGPLWNRRDGTFLWVDIVGGTIHRFRPGVGAEVFIRPSNKANGLTFDREGRLCVAGWASRAVWRVEPDGKITTLASHYQGKRINSPNDIVVRSDGAIYFTRGIGEIDRAVGAHHDVVRAVDALSLVMRGERRDLAVGFDPPYRARGPAGHAQPAFPVESEAVRLGRRPDKNFGAHTRLPAVDRVPDDVHPEECPVAPVPQRPLAEAQAVVDAIERRVRGHEPRKRRRRHVDFEHAPGFPQVASCEEIATTQGQIERLLHAWWVPRCTTVSPAFR